jgi:hypothetical protein
MISIEQRDVAGSATHRDPIHAEHAEHADDSAVVLICDLHGPSILWAAGRRGYSTPTWPWTSTPTGPSSASSSDSTGNSPHLPQDVPEDVTVVVATDRCSEFDPAHVPSGFDGTFRQLDPLDQQDEQTWIGTRKIGIPNSQ